MTRKQRSAEARIAWRIGLAALAAAAIAVVVILDEHGFLESLQPAGRAMGIVLAALLGLAILIGIPYWIIRLAVRHGTRDSQRR